jgi:hypothetical protein
MCSTFLLAATGGRDQRHAIPALCSRAGVIIASLALATSVAAQAPGSTTTVFDGTYAGVSREYSWIANPTPGNNVKCGQNGVPFPLTITMGRDGGRSARYFGYAQRYSRADGPD